MPQSRSGDRPKGAETQDPWIEIKAETVRKRNANFRIEREVEAMRYVQKHTSIPVPYVIKVQLGKGDDKEGWMLMERLKGVQLGTAWGKMDSTARNRAISQLKSYFTELHSLRPPTTPAWIGSCSKGPAYDHRIDNMTTCGPFKSIKAFHDKLVAPVGNVRPDWIPKYRSRLPDNDEIVFAHADISGENILVDPATGHITGIIDWEMAGFWPRWWEYRKGLCGARSEVWWNEILKKIMTAYPDAADADADLEMF